MSGFEKVWRVGVLVLLSGILWIQWQIWKHQPPTVNEIRSAAQQADKAELNLLVGKIPYSEPRGTIDVNIVGCEDPIEVRGPSRYSFYTDARPIPVSIEH